MTTTELNLDTPPGRIELAKILIAEIHKAEMTFGDGPQSASIQCLRGRAIGNMKTAISSSKDPQECFNTAAKISIVQREYNRDSMAYTILENISDMILKHAEGLCKGNLEGRLDLVEGLTILQAQYDKGSAKYNDFDEKRKLALGEASVASLDTRQLISLLRCRGLNLTLTEIERAHAKYWRTIQPNVRV